MGFSSRGENKGDGRDASHQSRRDPYEVLNVSRIATDQELRSAYRKLALKYHPDKNANDPLASDIFKEVTYSYSILSDPEKRRQFDASGFEAIDNESQELEVDLSTLGNFNTFFAAIFSKLGVPIKTTIPATVLEEALNGTVAIKPLQLGVSVCRKVEKQCAHFYSVEITEREAEAGLVCRVRSLDRSKFKLLYFELEASGGLSLALQEDSTKTGKNTSAGMFFLRFPVYHFVRTTSLATAKDPDSNFFRKLDGFQPCEINGLKAGTHVFAIYGDNFFKSASYRIEVLCSEDFSSEKEKLRDIEERIWRKRVELAAFEAEYREVLALFTEMTSRYATEMLEIEELLKEKIAIHASYTTDPSFEQSSSASVKSSGSINEEDKKLGSRNKKLFGIRSKSGRRKSC